MKSTLLFVRNIYLQPHAGKFWPATQHTLLFTHLYPGNSEASFTPWMKHRNGTKISCRTFVRLMIKSLSWNTLPPTRDQILAFSEAFVLLMDLTDTRRFTQHEADTGDSLGQFSVSNANMKSVTKASRVTV
jgi:hypothetical protein